MEIIAHSQNHIDFLDPKYTIEQKESEMLGSAEDILAHIGKKPLAFIYPYGRHDEQTARMTERLGFYYAFGTHYGIYRTGTNRYSMPRVRVHGKESIETFASLLSGRL